MAKKLRTETFSYFCTHCEQYTTVAREKPATTVICAKCGHEGVRK